MKGVLHSMILTKLKIASVLALTVAMVGMVAVVFAHPGEGAKQSAEKTAATRTVVVPQAKPDAVAEESKKLQGTWDFATLEIGGQALPEAIFKTSYISVRGQNFTSVTGQTVYKGSYRLDVTKNPRTIDLIFTDGPEKGNTSPGIYELNGDHWKLCLDVGNKARPREFSSKAGGHALETLTRRPAQAVLDDSKADEIKKAMARLEGQWSMVSGEINGQAMPKEMTAGARRVAKDGETSVTVNGQIFMKAKYTVDPLKKPMTIDYTMTDGPSKGKTQQGIYAVDGDTVKFCFASPGQDRPTDFTSSAGSNRTLSVWKRMEK
jgi:uncharacterized protein (TIGR03067 family)